MGRSGGFYWPTMYEDVLHHVKFYHECQIISIMKVHLSITISPPATIFSKVYIDVIYMPNARGYQYIVIARDDLTKYMEG